MRGEVRLSGVFDVGDVPRVSVDVVADRLEAAVGELDVVLALRGLAVAVLVVAEAGKEKQE